MIRPDFEIKGYDKFGNLLLHTWHIGESSRDVEIAAYRLRMKRGEVAYIDLFSLNDPKVQRIVA